MLQSYQFLLAYNLQWINDYISPEVIPNLVSMDYHI
jgi:hypothetical protein